MKLSQKTILQWMRKKSNHPMKFSELAKYLALPDNHRRKLRHLIKAMIDEGSIVKVRGRYALPSEMNLVPGTLQGNPNGYGFLILDDPKAQDIYIGAKNMAGAMHLDRVMIRVESRKRFERPEGRITRVLERKTKNIVGTFEHLEGSGWVIPSDSKHFRDILIPSKFKNKAKFGQLVSVEIIEYPTLNTPLTGKIIEVLGYSDDPESEIRSIFRKFELSTDFPYKVLEEVRRLPMGIDTKERQRRRDLTSWKIFTIDGETSKDFDDAVSIEATEKGFRLGVHIADVSYYIEENSYLDREARNRGTSIYFPDGVIPMLPFELSNELCSLKPQLERPTLSLIIDYDINGNILNHRIFNSIIKSCRRLTYKEVWQLIKTDNSSQEYFEVLPSLRLMHRLSQILRKRRIQNGSVDFFLPEPEIQMSLDGKVKKLTIAENNEAHQLIEEFMLAANCITAKYLNDKKVPIINRIHEAPETIKLENLNEFLETLGLHISHSKKIQTSDLQHLLQNIQGKPYERVINSLLLRAMKKAEYSVKNSGHFCLNFEYYTHFTSPIRRYPDLIIHRILKTFLQRKPTELQRSKLKPKCDEWARQSSMRERKAQEIEREIEDLRRCQFMKGKVGQKFSGVITSVTTFGFFVELENYFVEGLVKLSTMLDDYYFYIEKEHKLKGQNGFNTFQIGDLVNVRLADVQINKRKIEFTLTTP